MDLKSIYENILNERTKLKKNKRKINGKLEDGINPSCGDIIQVEIKLDEEKEKIEDIAFSGEGCAISEASADIMCDILRGQKKEYAIEICTLFIQMILEAEENIEENEFGIDERYEKLGDAYALKALRYVPARIKCVLLSWNTAKKALEEMEK